MPRFNRSPWLFVAGLLAACAAPPPHHGSEGRSSAGPAPGHAAPQPPAGFAVWRIDGERSEVRVLVYRAGTLANLGHNHVIRFRPERAWVAWADDEARSKLRLEFSVASARVDDPAMRREEGADFPGDVDDGAIQGTLHNMLSEALLDAAHFPIVTVDGGGLTKASSATDPGADKRRVTLSLRVAGHESGITVPVNLQRANGMMTASGEFEVSQTELGLRPFSIMLGALQVRDRMNVKYRIVAHQ